MPHFISLEKAIEMTKTFRDNLELPPLSELREQFPLCQTYDRAAIDKILSQEGCEKIRIYVGMDEELKLHNIIVGVNSNDEDMLPKASTEETNEERDDEIVIVNEGVPCPPTCPPPSDLNP